jgi:hypothetical protein
VFLGWLFMLLGFVSAPAEQLRFEAEVSIRNDIVRLGDIADVETLPVALRHRAAALPLAKLPAHTKTLKLSVVNLSARARSLMPSLGPWLKGQGGTVSIIRRNSDPMQLVAISNGKNGVLKNQSVQLVLNVGIYSIERRAIAMSDAKAGQRFFARTEDQKVLSVFCCGE